MSITYDPSVAAKSAAASRPAAASKPAAVRGKGFWGRLLDRMVEARMKQAEAEIRRYNMILPSELSDADISAGAQDKAALPFVR